MTDPSGIGLTKREAFAMAAMNGLMAQPDDRRYPAISGLSVEDWQGECRKGDARLAVEMADALIKVLSDDANSAAPKLRPGTGYRCRDGREARIYATDGAGPRPIHGAVFHEGEWIQSCWSAEGFVDFYVPPGSNPCNTDLVLSDKSA